MRVVWDRQDSPRLLVVSDITPKDELAELIEEASQLIAILTSIIKETKADALLFHTSSFRIHPSSYGVLEIGSSMYLYIFVVNGQVRE